MKNTIKPLLLIIIGSFYILLNLLFKFELLNLEMFNKQGCELNIQYDKFFLVDLITEKHFYFKVPLTLNVQLCRVFVRTPH